MTCFGWPLWNICVTNDHGYVPFVSTSWFFPHLWLITECVTRFTIYTSGASSGAGTAYPSGALEFTQVYSGVRVARSLGWCVCFVDRFLSFCRFCLGHFYFLFFLDIQILIILQGKLFIQSVAITTNVVSSNPDQVRSSWYNIMYCSVSVICGRSVVFSGFSGVLHQ
jgi:hypothetical protein